MTKRKPSREELEFAFMHARLDEDERDISDMEPEYVPLYTGDPAKPEIVVARAHIDRARRELDAKRAIVRLNEYPQLNQDPAYYAGLWEAFLAVVSVYENHPDYGRLFG